MPEVVDKRAGAVFNVADVNGMSKYIVNKAKNLSTFKDIAVHNQNLARDNYSLRTNMKKIESIYHDLLTA